MTEHSHNPRILIIEDEAAMRVALQDALEAAEYRVLTANNGETGLKTALREKPDLLLLDIMMPMLDGYALCQELRRLSEPIPIIMVTAKSQVADRIHGLDIGADDYLVKPFSTEELLARVRAVLRRYTRPKETIDTLTLGSTQIDFGKQKAWRSGRSIHLTQKEFAMLRLLAESRGEVVSRERFLDVVWGYTAFPSTRTVDNHIAGLRAKIEPDPDNPRWLRTVHGRGYRLEADQENADFGEKS